MSKALEDIVVLDFSRYIAGPFCAMLLADMGAYVIKIDKPGIGEEMRVTTKTPNVGFPPFNRNKRSLGIDSRNPLGVEILKKLVMQADVLIQNFRPGTIEKMGLSYEVCKELNPRLVMINISGFGQTGSGKLRAAFDSVVQAESGMIYSIMQEGMGGPVMPGGNPCDMLTALHSTIAVLAALNQRDITGQGQYIDVDMMSCSTNMISNRLFTLDVTGKEDWQHTAVPYALFKTKDGTVHIGAEDHLWPDFAQVLGEPALQGEQYQDLAVRLAEEAHINEIIGKWASRYSSAEVTKMLEPKGVAVGTVKTIDKISTNEHLLSQGHIIDLPIADYGLTKYPAMPFRMSATQPDYFAAPTIGQNNQEILQRFLDLNEQQIAQLTESGVIHQSP